MILKFENFQESNGLQTLIEILETEMEDDFGFGACRWWKKVGDGTGYFRENSKDIFPIPEYDNDIIIVEIENKYLHRFIDHHLKDFKDELSKYSEYSSERSGEISLTEEKINKNEFFQRILNLTNYKIESVYYRNDWSKTIINFHFRIDKQ